MDNITINYLLKNNPSTKRFFLGCFPCDRIPFTDRYPYFVVANTDSSFQSGTHWIVIYVFNAYNAEYFDSYGELPNPCIQKYLENYKYVKINKFQIQSNFSEVCGQYCIYFSIKRSEGINFDEIIRKLKQIKEPDRFVRNHLLTWTSMQSGIC